MGMIIGSAFRDALCASMNGSDEYVYKDDPSFEGDTAGAIALRFRAATLLGANGSKAILSMGVRDAGNSSFIGLRQFRGATTSNQNRLQVIRSGGGAGNYFGGTALAATTWYSVVLQSTGSAWSIYLNGAAETLTNVSGSNTGDWFGDISGTDHRLTFGAQFVANAPGGYNDCRVNECIYVGGRVLTGAEITEWHNAGVTKNPHRLSFRADIDSWWRFGDSRDSATTIYDEVGSNDLTLVNMDASNYVAP